MTKAEQLAQILEEVNFEEKQNYAGKLELLLVKEGFKEDEIDFLKKVAMNDMELLKEEK
ncbi:hypothetical protein [Paraliobacillus salinarum]|uniref:hypothetical protein n=1 Tax=Paraliobacillus salinarum TaxID=1158996 RepID=UPI0015F4E1A8|nr:hypothetical protein [Paraliobacillus salinarum]